MLLHPELLVAISFEQSVIKIRFDSDSLGQMMFRTGFARWPDDPARAREAPAPF
jgi:hypothetical protein